MIFLWSNVLVHQSCPRVEVDTELMVNRMRFVYA